MGFFRNLPLHNSGHLLRFSGAIEAAKGMHMHGVMFIVRAVVRCRLRVAPLLRLRAHIRHCTTGEVFGIGHDTLERTVHPIHHALHRAKIHRKRKRRQLNRTNALKPRAQIQAHFGFAKAVNRLHRITHHKQRSAIIRLPAGGQARQQVKLRQRRILKLIHQQMGYAVIQRQREIRWRIRLAQCAQRGLRHRREIGLSAFTEQQFKIRRSQRQQHGQRLDDAPLKPAVGRGRQRARKVQRIHKRAVRQQCCHQCGMARLGRTRSGLFKLARAGREASVFIDDFAQHTLFGEQQRCNATPCLKVISRCAR